MRSSHETLMPMVMPAAVETGLHPSAGEGEG